jgi:hypothetical protein
MINRSHPPKPLIDRLAWFFLGVIGILLVAAILASSLIVLHSVMHPASAQDDQHGWVIGLCVDDQFKITTCRRIGGVLPDEKLCRTVAASVAKALSVGRVHCTRVLVDNDE